MDANEPQPEYITQILDRVDRGEREALGDLLESAYAELRALAGSFFSQQRPDHTLQPTALVHEAFVKLTSGKEVRWESRRHFFIVAGKAMRHLLMDHARRRGRDKRGGDWQRVTLSETPRPTGLGDLDAIALEEALAKLEGLNPRHAQIVELRFLAGLSTDEIAEILECSKRTVELDWRQARAWLRGELES